jgi:HSP20 family protein
MNKTAEKAPLMERGAPAASSVTMLDDMESMLQEMMPRGWMRRMGWPSWGELTRPIERFAPRVNVLDRDDEIVVEAEIPGFRKEDVEISVTENAVTIEGRSHRKEKEEKGNYYRCEIANDSFSRTVALPGVIDTAKAKGSFADGMLKLELPKVAKAVRRHIELR